MPNRQISSDIASRASLVEMGDGIENLRRLQVLMFYLFGAVFANEDIWLPSRDSRFLCESFCAWSRGIQSDEWYSHFGRLWFSRASTFLNGSWQTKFGRV